MAPGRYSVSWNGRNSSGRQVADGIYFYKMAAGRFTATRKMLIVR
jgi:flagellar hook assembly protein FlgD